VVHGNSIAYPYGAERYGSAASHPDTCLDRFQYLVQVDMAGDYFIVGMGYAYQRPTYLFIGISHGFHQGAMGGTFNSFFNEVTSHGFNPALFLILGYIKVVASGGIYADRQRVSRKMSTFKAGNFSLFMHK
jgi:hypothetical protein